jgi:hypothetical protein
MTGSTAPGAPHCSMDLTPAPSYLDLEQRLAAAEADRDALIAEIQKWREGRAYLGVPMTYVDQRLVDATRTFIGNKRADGVKP